MLSGVLTMAAAATDADDLDLAIARSLQDAEDREEQSRQPQQKRPRVHAPSLAPIDAAPGATTEEQLAIDLAIARSLEDAESGDDQLQQPRRKAPRVHGSAPAAVGAASLAAVDRSRSAAKDDQEQLEIDLAIARSLHDAEEAAEAARRAASNIESDHSQIPRGSRRCGLPGCVQPPVDRGAHAGFCCPKHHSSARARSLLPPPSDDIERAFCAPSGTYACLLLTRASADRQPLIDQFGAAWRKPVPRGLRAPRVERVYRIVADARVRERFDAYAARVGNVRRRFHGTSLARACSFGIDLAAAPCTEAACRVCGIMQHGFSLTRAGTGPNAGRRLGLRYGHGLYFSATSGKSNDYAWEAERWRAGRAWRCMLVASVAAGRAFCTHEGELELDVLPPDGFNSVVGEVGANLNYDELVVYDEAAAIPEYLLVYSL